MFYTSMDGSYFPFDAHRLSLYMSATVDKKAAILVRDPDQDSSFHARSFRMGSTWEVPSRELLLVDSELPNSDPEPWSEAQFSHKGGNSAANNKSNSSSSSSGIRKAPPPTTQFARIRFSVLARRHSKAALLGTVLPMAILSLAGAIAAAAGGGSDGGSSSSGTGVDTDTDTFLLAGSDLLVPTAAALMALLLARADPQGRDAPPPATSLSAVGEFALLPMAGLLLQVVLAALAAAGGLHALLTPAVIAVASVLLQVVGMAGWAMRWGRQAAAVSAWCAEEIQQEHQRRIEEAARKSLLDKLREKYSEKT
jgi:hypothetical protein